MDPTNATMADRLEAERALEGFLGVTISDVTALSRTWTADTCYDDLEEALLSVSAATAFLAMVAVGITPWDARTELQWEHRIPGRELIEGMTAYGINPIIARDLLGYKQGRNAVPPMLETPNETFCPNCGLEWNVERVGKTCRRRIPGTREWEGCGEIIRKPVLR